MKKKYAFICTALLLCSSTTFGQTVIEQKNFTSVSATNKAAAKTVILTGTLSTRGNSDFRQLRDLGYEIERIELTNSNCPTIPNNALMCMHTLKTIKLPNNLITIGSQAFSYCDNMTSIGTIPAEVRSIGIAAFSNCKKLESLNFASNSALRNIGSYAFVNNSTLRGTVTIPSGVSIIRQGTFASCPKIVAVRLPNNLQEIEAQAFDGCSSLSTINLGEFITDIGASSFSRCKSLTELTLPKVLRCIKSCAFKSCGLRTITIPNATKTIEEGAFEDCKNLTKIIIQGNIANLPAMTFANCTRLKTIELATTTPPNVDTTSFDGIKVSRITLFVPNNAINNYKKAAIWKKFKIKGIS